MEIRKLPSHIYDEALILVQWFWSKNDIEEEFLKRSIEIPASMRR